MNGEYTLGAILMGALRERQRVGVWWDRYAGGLHLDLVGHVRVDIVLLQDVCDHDETEASNQVLADAGSLADAEGQEVWNVLLDAEDLLLAFVR